MRLWAARGPSRSGRSIVGRWVVAVLGLLLGAAALAALVFIVRGETDEAKDPAQRLGGSSTDLTVGERAAAVERTMAAGSARIDATYRPARGPTVVITGRTSLVGPESEVFASVGHELPAGVRVTTTGAWLRAPGTGDWTPVVIDQVAGAAASRGWADLLRDLDGSTAVQTDASGRIVRMRLTRDRRGGTLDVRLSAFGTEVVTVPP